MAAGMQGTNSSKSTRLPETTRLIALTDGLFATVLTVLVLGFRLPEIDNPNLLVSPTQFFKDIVDLTPSLLSYVLTFLVAGFYWHAHHRVFENIPRTDQRLIWCNLMFLLSVGLLPFSTQLAGVARVSVIPWTVYCINMVLIGLTFSVEWGYAVTHGLREGDAPRQWRAYMLVRLLSTPGIFLASLVAAQFNPRLAYFFPVLIPFGRIAANQIFSMPEQEGEAGLIRKGRPLTELIWVVAIYFPVILLAVWLIWFASK
jgi:uncharacterized membrane protein